MKVALIDQRKSDQEFFEVRKNYPNFDLLPSDKITNKGLENYSVLWFHSSKGITNSMRSPGVKERMRNFVESGGGLFLSLLATTYVNILGYEPTQFQVIAERWKREEDFTWSWDFVYKKGYQCFIEHPTFHGLGGCIYLWQSDRGKNYWRAGPDKFPKEGKVIAVRKRFIFVDREIPELIEYNLGKGKIVTASSFLQFSDKDYFYMLYREKIVKNILRYLSGELDGPKHYWPPPSQTIPYVEVDSSVLRPRGSSERR